MIGVKIEMLKNVRRKITKRFEGTKYWNLLTRIYQLPRTCNPKFILKKTGFKRWKPNIEIINLDITYRCSLNCFNCNRSVRQAPATDDISINQIKKFLNESKQLNWQWKRISLMGGEPTLHPQFFKILDILNEYHNQCDILVSTNGYGTKVNEVIKEIPDWVYVINTKKVSPIQEFVTYNVAPIDLKKYQNSDFSRGCEVTEICGIGLNRYGYYACAEAASVDRVFGFDIGIKKLSDVNGDALRLQLNKLCRYCGTFKENTDLTTKEDMSETWKSVYRAYRKSKPKLSIY